MFYPNLLFTKSLIEDESGNATPLKIIPTAMETVIPNEYHKGLPVHRLEGLLALEPVDVSDLRAANGKYVIEANIWPEPLNTTFACTSDWPNGGEYNFFVNNSQVGIYIGQGGYGVLLDRWQLPIDKRTKFYHIALVVDGANSKIYIDGVLLSSFALGPSSSKVKSLLTSSNINNRRYSSSYRGKIAGLAFHGGITLTPDQFTLLNPPSSYSAAVQLAKFVPTERTVEYSDSLVLLGLEIQGPNVIFKFNNNKSFVINRPVLDTPGRSISGAAINSSNEVVLSFTDNTTQNLGVLPVADGGSSEFNWIPGVGYLSSTTEDRKYIPIRVNDNLFLNATSESITVGIKPITDTPVVFLNKLILEWVVSITDRINPITTANTWIVFNWNRLQRDSNDSATLGNLSKILLPAGNYYLDGTIPIHRGGTSKARVYSVTRQETLAESDCSYQDTNNSGVSNLIFNDLIKLQAVEEIEIQFMTVVGNQATTIVTTLGIVQGSYAKLTLFKV